MHQDKVQLAKDPVKAHDEYVTDVLNQKLLQGTAGTLFIPEIFEAVSQFSNFEKKIKVLRANNKPALQIVLRLTYDKEIKFNFSYKELMGIDVQPMDIPDFDTAPITLLSEAKRLVALTNRKQGVQLSKEKSLKIATEMMSAMHENDRLIFTQMVQGRIDFKGMTERLVLHAFPKLIPGMDPTKEEPKKTDDKKPEPTKTEKVETIKTDGAGDNKPETTEPETVQDKPSTTATGKTTKPKKNQNIM